MNPEPAIVKREYYDAEIMESMLSDLEVFTPADIKKVKKL